MGLNERRAAKQFRDDIFPVLQTEIRTAAGFDLDFDVDWESLSEYGRSHMYEEGWAKVYFEPIRLALHEICRDELGRAALEHGVRKIRIQNKSGITSAEDCFSIEDKTITCDHRPLMNVHDVTPRSTALTTLLENAL